MTTRITEALGPFKRYAIWVQGCERRCAGCISEDSQPIDGGYRLEITDLAADIINTLDIEGITISGGEPYLQEESLVSLISLVRAKRDLGVIIYTGFIFDEIKDNKLTAHADIIIDGEYINKLDDGRSLRGSSNQNVIFTTNRYKEYTNMYGMQGRKAELRIKNEKVMLVGIPDKNTYKILKGEQP